MKQNKFIAGLMMVFLSLLSNAIIAQHGSGSAIEGRWDLTVNEGNRIVPSWLEVRHSGTKMLVGYFVADGGSARPVARVEFNGSKMSFTVPPQWDKGDNDIAVEGTLENDKLSGTMISADGRKFTWTGERAPALRPEKQPAWGSPLQLFNGKDTKGWHPSGTTNQWVAENGILKSPRSGSNFITDQKFQDFKLHIEFRYPKESNSGVYLRGRYEVQVADSKGKEPLKDEFSAIYGFLSPTHNLAKAPGEWQTYDITIYGRFVTVVANGKTVICNQEIPGITGGALDSKESEPGPIMLQGDHGPIEYRNIVITPAK
ncbi:MAG: 3-keto-disaccharide hydrolase [Chitinophagaceae bacterium]